MGQQEKDVKKIQTALVKMGDVKVEELATVLDFFYKQLEKSFGEYEKSEKPKCIKYKTPRVEWSINFRIAKGLSVNIKIWSMTLRDVRFVIKPEFSTLNDHFSFSVPVPFKHSWLWETRQDHFFARNQKLKMFIHPVWKDVPLEENYFIAVANRFLEIQGVDLTKIEREYIYDRATSTSLF